MRKMEVSNLEILKYAIHEILIHNRESRYLHRLHCVLLVGQGFSCYQVAEWFSEHKRTIERWAHAFQEYGADGLKDKHKAGRPPKLREDQLKILQLGYKQNDWDGKLLKTHIEHHYGVELSLRQCQRLLLKLRP